jgi:thiol-disulfide isomerase/thioredoxin
MACAASAAPGPHRLSVGDPAPSLSAAIPLKGHPPTRFELGKVYIVEFWATWCGPCKQNIPKLTALAKEYGDRVSITGVSIWETTDAADTGYLKRVNAFVKGEGDKMAYNVAADDLRKDVADTWMKAAGEGAIPTTFIVGKEGRIAWIGHPEGLEAALPKVLAGQKLTSDRSPEREAVQAVEDAIGAKKYSEALALIEDDVKKWPTLEHFMDYYRLTALYHSDLPKGIELSEKIKKDSNGDSGAYRMMCSIFATQPDLSPEAYRYGMGLTDQAVAKGEMKYLFLSMEAATSGNMKDLASAVRFEQQAIDAASKDSHAPPQFIDFLKRNLAKYQQDLRGTKP